MTMEVTFKLDATTIHGDPVYKETKDENDNTIPAKDRKLVSLEWFLLEALMAQEKDLSAEQKLERFALAEKIRDSKNRVTLSVDDAVLIKKVAGENLGTSFAVPIIRIITKADEGKSAE